MRPLRFLHLPKTAGSSFTSLLRRQYFGKRQFAFSGDEAADLKRFQSLSVKKRKRVALFTGHASLTTGIREADEALTITFLRNPVSRVISYCQHVSEGKSEHLKETYPPETFNLDAFLDSGDPELFNLQTRILIEDQTIAPDPFKIMTAADARDAALENLFNRIYKFGLQELFDESLLIFAGAMGWSLPMYARLNEKHYGKLLEIEPHHIERIKNLNAIDLELYRVAKDYFCSQLLPSIDAGQLQRFRRIQRLAALPLKGVFHCIELLSARR